MIRFIASSALAFSLALIVLAGPANAADRTLSWAPVTTDSAGNPLPATVTVTYNVYGAIQGSPLKLLANVTTTKTVRPNQDAGTACYAVSALLTPASAVIVQESTLVPTICDTIAPPPPPKPAAPATPTGFQIQQTPTPITRYVPFARRRRMYA